MKVLLLRANCLTEQDRDAHQGSLLYPLLALASHVDRPDRVRIATYPEDAQYIRESLAWCDAVGVGPCTFEYEATAEVVRALKREYPEKIYFIGGVHVTSLGRYDSTLFDFMVAGEAERVLAGLVGDEIPAGRGSATTILKADRLLSGAELPLVRYRDYPAFERLRQRPGERPSVITSRGCQFRSCRYCSAVSYHPVHRVMPVARAAEQIRLLVEEWGSRSFNVWDEAFGNRIPYMSELTRQLQRDGITLERCSAFVRFTDEILTREAFAAFDAFGLQVLLPGLESGNPRMLRYLKGPHARVRNCAENLVAAHKLGFPVLASFIFGNPTETLAEMEDTLRFIEWIERKQLLDVCWVYVATPWPGSSYWGLAAERGFVRHDMDFRELDYRNFGRPLLLADGVDVAAFRDLYLRASDVAERIRRRAFGQNGPI